MVQKAGKKSGMAGISDTIKGTLRRAANRLGYDIIGYDADNPRARLSKLLGRSGITVLFDVGANSGSFGWDMRELQYSGKIVSFEPLKDAFARLQKMACRDPNWEVLNIGLGAQDEERAIHVAANSQSSSFLAMLDAHARAAPESGYQEDQPASLRRLDHIFADYCRPSDKVFLKIDTQGFEKKVLEGAGQTLAAMPLVQLECSLVPLYAGAEKIEDMIGYMRALGYDPVDAVPTFHDKDSGHMMQADVLFLRRST